MSAKNEMESQYSISDIEIGKVTVIGIYRGEFTKSIVESKINRNISNSSGNSKVHYIDVISIIQEINV